MISFRRAALRFLRTHFRLTLPSAETACPPSRLYSFGKFSRRHKASIAVAATVDGAPRLFSVPLDGSVPTPLVREYSVDPAWSSDGRLLVYSGPDIGTTFVVKTLSADTSATSGPKLMLSRGSRHLAFLPGRGLLLVLRGEISHKDVWAIDLGTGAERQLTHFAPGFDVRDFDISPDGREIVVEQVQEHSDIVLIDLLSR